MSNLEDRLRDAFRADAETVRPQTIPDPPARPVRPARRAPKRAGSPLARAVAPLAAAAAVAAVAVGTGLAAPLLPGHGHPGPGASASSPSRPRGLTGHPVSPEVTGGPVPSPVLGPAASRGVLTSPPASGTPRFYVTVSIAPGGADSLVVRDTATGKIVEPARSAVRRGLQDRRGTRRRQNVRHARRVKQRVHLPALPVPAEQSGPAGPARTAAHHGARELLRIR